MKQKLNLLSVLFIVGFLIISLMHTPVQAGETRLQVTERAPTVTSTSVATWVIVRSDQDTPQINVRSGPGTEYDGIGVLLKDQRVPALGRTSGGDWILVEYLGVAGNQGWVYAPLVIIEGVSLPIVIPPATPTPLVTATIDPTLAAQFIITSVATRLPTFTAPPELVIPTFEDNSPTTSVGSIPMGLIIVGLAVLGGILGLITLTQNR
jgi:uncharacterized protein YraI